MYVGGSETFEDNVMETSKPMVIVTGSSGDIGSAVVRAFAEHFDLVGLDRETSPHPPIDAECVCVDLTSDESVATALQRVRHAHGARIASRSEERRVGNECVRTCRSRWSPSP